MKLELWALGYDKNNGATDYEKLLYEVEIVDNSSDLEKAVMLEIAKETAEKMQDGTLSLNDVPEDVYFLEVRLELVSQTETFDYEALDMLFSETFIVPSKEIYVLAHCSGDSNYTPEVFTRKKDAKKRLKELFENTIKVSKDAILIENFYQTSAFIAYTDDTYDNFQIFKVKELK